MALAGVHICFGLAQCGGSTELLPYHAIASDTMASAGTSAVTAPKQSAPVLLSISASAAIFYAVGQAPDPNAGPRRYYDPSFGREDIFVNSLDKFAWILA